MAAPVATAAPPAGANVVAVAAAPPVLNKIPSSLAPAQHVGNPFLSLAHPVQWGVWALPPPTAADRKGGAATVPEVSSPSSKAPAFFDNLHGEVIVLRPGKVMVSNRTATVAAPATSATAPFAGTAAAVGGGVWAEYPLRVSIADVVDAKLSPGRNLLALRVANREVKVIDTRTGDVVTARSCRDATSRMLAVHWINAGPVQAPGSNSGASSTGTSAATTAGTTGGTSTSSTPPAAAGTVSSLAGSSAAASASSSWKESGESFLLFVTNGGVELYALGSSGKLKHIKTVVYQLMHHWFCVEDNALLLVDHNRQFQAFKLSHKTITKGCKFHLETIAGAAAARMPDAKDADASAASGTRASVATPSNATSSAMTVDEENLEFVHSITLLPAYGRVVLAFVQPKRALVHLWTVALGAHAAGYPTPAANAAAHAAHAAAAAQAAAGGGSSSTAGLGTTNTVNAAVVSVGALPDQAEHLFSYRLPIPGRCIVSAVDDVIIVHQLKSRYCALFDLYRVDAKPVAGAPGGVTCSADATAEIVLPVGGLNSGVAAGSVNAGGSGSVSGSVSCDNRIFSDENLRFINPSFILDAPKETTRRTLYTLSLDVEAIAAHWPIAKKTKLIDFLLKRSTAQAKALVLKILYDLVCARSSLALLSRLFLTLNRICYDSEMERQSTPSAGAASDKAAASASTTGASASTSLAPPAGLHHTRSASLPAALTSLPSSAGGTSAALDHIQKHIHKSPLSPQSARSVLNSLIESSYAPTASAAAPASASGLPSSIRSAPNSPQSDLTPVAGRGASLTASAASSPVAPGSAAAGAAVGGVMIGEGTLSVSTPASPVAPARSGGSVVTSPEAPGGPSMSSGRLSGVGSGSMSEPGPMLTHSMSMSGSMVLPGGGGPSAGGGALGPLPPDGVSAAAFAAAQLPNSPSGAAPPPAASSGASAAAMAASGVLVPSNRLSAVLSPAEGGPGGRMAASLPAPLPRLDEKGPPQVAIPLARAPSSGLTGSIGDASAGAGTGGGVTISVPRNGLGFLVMSQFDLFDFVFFPASKVTAPSVLIPYLNEYLRTIYRHFLKTDECLHELLVSLLIRDRRYFELHQYLQYHIVNDSVAIALTLLDLGEAYPPAYQLALDMLYRLNSFSRLLEVMLRRRQVLAALRLVSVRSPWFDMPGLTPADWLKVAKDNCDPNVFYATYKFFEARNAALRSGDSRFPASDNCQAYTSYFQLLFSTPDTSPLALPVSIALPTAGQAKSIADGKPRAAAASNADGNGTPTAAPAT